MLMVAVGDAAWDVRRRCLWVWRLKGQYEDMIVSWLGSTHSHTTTHTWWHWVCMCVSFWHNRKCSEQKRERERAREREFLLFLWEGKVWPFVRCVVMMMMWRFPGEFLHVDEAREKVRLWWDDLMLFSLTEAVPVGGASASPVHTHLSDSHTLIGLRNTLQFSS